MVNKLGKFLKLGQFIVNILFFLPIYWLFLQNKRIYAILLLLRYLFLSGFFGLCCRREFF